MNIETLLRESAERIREEAAERSKDLHAPKPSRRLPLALAVAAVSVVLLVSAAIAIDLSTLLDDSTPPTGTGSLAEQVPEGWMPGTLESAGVDYWVPDVGWRVIEESLTPDFQGLPGSERFKDTIISFATYPARPGTSIPICANKPQTALEQLGPEDALISVLELDHALVDEYPDRLRATGIYERSPEQFYPYIGEVNNDFCYDRANEGRAEPLFHREYIFRDQGRVFVVTVGIGGQASEQTKNQVWTILDRLTFQPQF